MQGMFCLKRLLYKSLHVIDIAYIKSFAIISYILATEIA